MLVRLAKSSDANTIAIFNKAMALETENKNLPDETILLGVKNLMAQPQFGFYVVAEIENKLLGCLMITYEWSDWRNGIIWWLQSVYVKTDFRKQNVFKNMLQYVESKSQENNVASIRLYMEKGNRNAHKTYERCGFQETDYIMFEKLIFRNNS